MTKISQQEHQELQRLKNLFVEHFGQTQINMGRAIYSTDFLSLAKKLNLKKFNNSTYIIDKEEIYLFIQIYNRRLIQ